MVKTPAVHLAHLEEESANKDEAVDSEDPGGIEGVTEDFMVHLVRAVKEAQNKAKCCYHCSSLNHFIHDCQLVKASRTDSHLNCKEGMAQKKEPGPSDESDHANDVPRGVAQGIEQCTQTLFLNPDPFQ